MPDNPTDRPFKTEMDGLVIVEASKPISIVLTNGDYRTALPANAESCAIALGLKRQLASPFVHVMRSRAYAALPDKSADARSIDGLPGTWAMFKFQIGTAAREAIIAVDTGELPAEGQMIDLLPVRKSETRVLKRLKNKRFRKPKGFNDGRGKRFMRDALTMAGVRNYTGRSPL